MDGLGIIDKWEKMMIRLIRSQNGTSSNSQIILATISEPKNAFSLS